jgi:undecaprenyl diphosphate synthase
VQATTTNELPCHVAIIMDGNGRWASKRGLLRKFGHEQGSKTAENIINYAHELGIKYITLYAFSSENWLRPKDEVNGVMSILENYLKKDVAELVKNGVKVLAIGDLKRLPKSLNLALNEVINKTAHGQKQVLTLALSYGSWEEVTNACVNISAQKKAVTKDLLQNNLYTKDLPPPDLLIRTGGEVRLSNFLLLQLSYSELYFSPTLWPDFQKADLDLAIKSFQARKRRYGAL